MSEKKINWKKVKSSQIKQVAFVADKDSSEDGSLMVEFVKGDIWEYTPFDVIEYQEFLEASSIGSYFHSNIKSFKAAKRIS